MANKARELEVDTTVRQAVMLILHIMRNLRQSGMEIGSDIELSYPQILILYALLENGAATMGELSRWLKITQGVATRTVDGLVDKATTFSLSEMKALPSRTQITRHDCVEGWSAIGKWKGAKLSALLDMVHPKPEARFVVFHCADPMEANGASPYYESIDLDDAYHAQSILAYELNDKALPVQNGAPLRLRVERQLGYKHAKYVMRIELVDSFAKIAGGNGGYWEDNGYEWYAGI